jgi:hypothetical protein
LSALKLTVQELLLAVLVARVQGLGVTLELEAAGPLVLKLTVP